MGKALTLLRTANEDDCFQHVDEQMNLSARNRVTRRQQVSVALQNRKETFVGLYGCRKSQSWTLPPGRGEEITKDSQYDSFVYGLPHARASQQL